MNEKTMWTVAVALLMLAQFLYVVVVAPPGIVQTLWTMFYSVQDGFMIYYLYQLYYRS